MHFLQDIQSMASELLGEEEDIDVPFVAGHSTNIYSLHFLQLLISSLAAIHCTKKLLMRFESWTNL